MSKQRSYADPKGCDLCHADYVTFIAVQVDGAYKDICSGCELALRKKKEVVR